MSSSLKQIKQPIEQELKEFEKHFKKAMESSIPLLDKISYYIVKRKGKQLRPIFVFLSSQAFGQINDSSYTAASLIELLHTGTLAHDDVVDNSYKRRGFFSLNALWKNKIAVLVGDFLLSRGFLLALDKKEYKMLHILSTAVKEMSEGEILQLEKARRLDIKEDIYFEIIKGKTASLFAAACAAGTSAVTQDEEEINLMHSFGLDIGLAFQIKDDLFDYGNDNIGKPKGIDIKEKKMTLPLIYALNHTDSKTKKKIINSIKKDSENPETVRTVIEFVQSSGGLEYAAEKMNEIKQRAIVKLDKIPNANARKSLLELVEFVINRTK